MNGELGRKASIAAILLIALLPFIAPLLENQVFSFRDHRDYFVPLRWFTAEVLRGGEIPWWNPYNGSGEPWLANPQTGVFYPPSWLFVVLPFPAAYASFLGLHVGILGLGSFLLFRRWSTEASALLGSVGMMLGGPTLSYLDINNNLASFAWLPLLLWCAVARGGRAPTIPRSLGAGLLALMFLAGEPYLALIGAVLFATILLVLRRGRSIGEVSFAGAVTIALTAVQLVPFAGLLAGSDRLRGLPRESVFGQSLPPWSWLSISASPAAFPDLQFLDLSQHFIASLFLGVPLAAGVVLFGLRMVFGRRDVSRVGVAAFWVVLFSIMALVASGDRIPFVGATLVALRFDVSRHAARVAPVAALALVALAVLGLDSLRRSGLLLRVVAVSVVALMTGAALVVFRPPGYTLSWRGSLEPSLMVILTLLVFAFRPGVLQRRGPALIAAAVLAADLLTAARPLLTTEQFVPTVAPYNRLVGRDEKVGRVLRPAAIPLAPRWWLSGYLNLFDRVVDVSTPAPVVSADYLSLHDLALREARMDLVDYLSVGWLLTERPLMERGLERVGSVGSVDVIRNPGRLPIATAWRSVQAVDATSALHLIRFGGADLRRVLLVAGGTGLPQNGGEVSGAPFQPLDASFQCNEVRLTTELPWPAIVSLSQRASPGWSVDVDGRNAEPLLVNGLFRGVAVESGRHEILWRYRSPRFGVSVLISLLGLLACAVEVGLHARERAHLSRELEQI